MRSPALLTSLALLAACVLPGAPEEHGRAPIESADEFFGDEGGGMWAVHIDGWPDDRMAPSRLAEAQSYPGARLRIYRMTDRDRGSEHFSKADPRQGESEDDATWRFGYYGCSLSSEDEVVHELQDDGFSIRTSGNMTNGTPKSSYKIKLRDRRDEFGGIRALNLKSMWNDPSQMREALIWQDLFPAAGVPGPRHTYARLCINSRYYGLYSVIEQVDQELLQRVWNKNDDGSLYKANWRDVGPATLEHRGDTGRAYFARDPYRATDVPAALGAGTTVERALEIGESEQALRFADDVDVFWRIAHPRPEDLRVTLEHRRGGGVARRKVVWDRRAVDEDETPAEGMWFDDTIFVERDPGEDGRRNVNGRWVLRIENAGDVPGELLDFVVRPDNRSYGLQSNDEPGDDPERQTYDDLARFIAVINGVGHQDGYPETEEYRREVEEIFDPYTFLRWAGVNMLVGAWDNYWGTPANYYLYNSGRQGAPKKFMRQPYFHWIPWDYDNTFGIDRFGVSWHRAEVVDWEAATAGYHGGARTSRLPLIRNLLRNPHFRRYYLDHLEYLARDVFTDEWITRRTGFGVTSTWQLDRPGDFWRRVATSAYLEARKPSYGIVTGRAFTNDQVTFQGPGQIEWPDLSGQGCSGQRDRPAYFICGLRGWVNLRRDSILGGSTWDGDGYIQRWRDRGDEPTFTGFPHQPGALPAAAP